MSAGEQEVEAVGRLIAFKDSEHLSRLCDTITDFVIFILCLDSSVPHLSLRSQMFQKLKEKNKHKKTTTKQPNGSPPTLKVR